MLKAMRLRSTGTTQQEPASEALKHTHINAYTPPITTSHNLKSLHTQKDTGYTNVLPKSLKTKYNK